MKRFLRVVTGAAALALSVGAAGIAWNLGLLPSSLETRIERATARVATATFETLFSESVMRSAIDRTADNNRGTRGGRIAVFDEFLCRPVFGETHDGGNGKGRANCYAGLYGSEYQYEKAGLPVRAVSLIQTFRSTAIGTAKAHLAKPENLRALYARWSSTALARFATLAIEERATALEGLEVFAKAFEELHKPVIQTALLKALQAERDWLTKTDNDLRYAAMRTADAELRELGDEYALRFAARRHAEGGRALVATYAELTRDFISRARELK